MENRELEFKNLIFFFVGRHEEHDSIPGLGVYYTQHIPWVVMQLRLWDRGKHCGIAACSWTKDKR